MANSQVHAGLPETVDEPPSYQVAQAHRQVDTIRTVIMQQYSAGPAIGPHLIRTGKLLSVQADLISIPHTTSYDDMLKLLHARFQARSGIQAPSETTLFYCRIAIDHDERRVLLDSDSWSMAKALLLSTTTADRQSATGKGTELVFMFAVKPKDQARPRADRLRALFAKEDRGATCLIEPVL